MFLRCNYTVAYNRIDVREFQKSIFNRLLTICASFHEDLPTADKKVCAHKTETSRIFQNTKFKISKFEERELNRN